MSKRWIELSVGFLMLLALISLVFLVFEVSGLTLRSFSKQDYTVSALFNDVGTLRVRAPIRIAGVEIGNVTNITLNPKTFQAIVTLSIHSNINDIPSDSSIKITSAGLLGDSYIALTPGYASTNLIQGSVIETTYSATSLESLISTFMAGGKSNVQTNS